MAPSVAPMGAPMGAPAPTKHGENRMRITLFATLGLALARCGEPPDVTPSPTASLVVTETPAPETPTEAETPSPTSPPPTQPLECPSPQPVVYCEVYPEEC